MSDQRLTALIMLLACGLVLLLGIATGGQGFWDRETSPVRYWSTMVLFGLLAVIAAYSLIVG